MPDANETTQSQTVVLAVVVLLGLFALVGLTGTIWLVHDKIEASAVAIVSTLTGAAIGALGTLLASTRSGAGAQAVAAKAVEVAVNDMQAAALAKPAKPTEPAAPAVPPQPL